MSAEAVPGRGWHIVATYPGGDALRPQVIDDVQWQPQLNGLPRIRIPVPKRKTWEGTSMEGQPIKVYKNGRRLPIDEIVATERGDSRDTIVARGGSELTDVVTEIEVAEGKRHVEAENIIQNNTSYATNFDTPDTRVLTDQILKTVTTTDELKDALRDHPFDADRPVEVTASGELQMQQTGFFAEAEDVTLTNVTSSAATSVSNADDGYWSNNETVPLDQSGEKIAFDFTFNYQTPDISDHPVIFLFAFTSPDNANNPKIDISLVDGDGIRTNLRTFQSGDLATTNTPSGINGHKIATVNLNDPDQLTAGETYTVEIDSNSSPSNPDPVYVDWLYIRDNRFDYNTPVQIKTDDDGNGTEVIKGHEQYPKSETVVFDRVPTIDRTIQVSADIDINGNTQNNQSLAVRNDKTASFSVKNNSNNIERSFANGGQIAQARVTLSRYDDDGSFSGDFGNATQKIVTDGDARDALVITASLENVPVLLNESYHGPLVDILNDIAGTEFVWEVRWSESQGKQIVEFAQPGQRTSDEPQLIEFEGRRTVENKYEKARVFGVTKSVEGETFLVDSNFNLEGLDETFIQVNSETVFETGNRDATFERGVDYKMEYQKGAINPLSSGSLSSNTEFGIDYEYQINNTYAEDGVASPDVIEEEVPAARTERQAGQAARQLVEDLSEPLEEVTVVVDDVDPGLSLVDAIQTDKLPFEGPLEKRDISQSPRRVEITLGSRSSAGEIIARIQRKLEETASQV